MHPVIINGELWQVVLVPPGSPALIDWTGTERLGTSSYATKVIAISSAVAPPLLDKVLLHEVSHAITATLGLPNNLDEFVAKIVEEHAVEATVIASEAIGRPLCIRGYCSHHARHLFAPG